jgi:hypothetical protein
VRRSGRLALGVPLRDEDLRWGAPHAHLTATSPRGGPCPRCQDTKGHWVHVVVTALLLLVTIAAPPDHIIVVDIQKPGGAHVPGGPGRVPRPGLGSGGPSPPPRPNRSPRPPPCLHRHRNGDGVASGGAVQGARLSCRRCGCRRRYSASAWRRTGQGAPGISLRRAVVSLVDPSTLAPV